MPAALLPPPLESTVIGSERVITIRLAGRGAPLDLLEIEQAAVRAALNATNGQQVRAAALLGVTKRVLNYKLKEWGWRPMDTAGTSTSAT